MRLKSTSILLMAVMLLGASAPRSGSGDRDHQELLRRRQLSYDSWRTDQAGLHRHPRNAGALYRGNGEYRRRFNRPRSPSRNGGLKNRRLSPHQEDRYGRTVKELFIDGGKCSAGDGRQCPRRNLFEL